MCEWDDVIVAGLAREGCGGVRRCGRGIDGDGVGDVAGGEEGAF
jgi:hypothetical protein